MKYSNCFSFFTFIKLFSCSCEVLPNKTGSMMFTNNQATTIMSETFFLKDSTARGLQRYFSIILGNKEKGFILRSFTEIQQEILLRFPLLFSQIKVRNAQFISVPLHWSVIIVGRETRVLIFKMVFELCAMWT